MGKWCRSREIAACRKDEAVSGCSADIDHSLDLIKNDLFAAVEYDVYRVNISRDDKIPTHLINGFFQIDPSMSTTTLVMYAYQLTFKNGKAGYGMAVTNVLMLMMLVIALFQQRYMRRDVSEI